MNAGRNAGRLVVGLTILAVLAGCDAGASTTQPQASSTPASAPSSVVATPPPPTTVATPSSTPAPVSYGPVSVVTGTSTCPTMDCDRDDRPRRHAPRPGGNVTCNNKTDDPRVSGRHTAPGTWNVDLWGDLDAGHFSLVQWATVRLENDGWCLGGPGSRASPPCPDAGTSSSIWYKGTGGYAGLSYFELDTGQDPWKIQGQVFPGDPPPPYSEDATGTERPEAGGPVADDAVAVVTGTGTCPTADLGNATTDADGVTHYRGGTFRCTVTTDDPRVSGTETAPGTPTCGGRSTTARSSSGAPRASRTTAGPGRASSPASPPPDRGDIIAIWYKGTGDYAGLSLLRAVDRERSLGHPGSDLPGRPADAVRRAVERGLGSVVAAQTAVQQRARRELAACRKPSIRLTQSPSIARRSSDCCR